MRPLSKSKIIAFRQCPKRLWLEIHKPELREETASTKASYRVGHQAGDIAKRIYDPAGKGVEVNAQRDGFREAFTQSTKLLSEHQQPIFEAGLKIEGAVAFADVMLPDLTGDHPGWKMIEVKFSTSVKDYYREDIAVQSYIAQAAGVNLKSVSLACIDSSWVYPGNGDYQGLLAETDLTAETLARSEEAKGWIAEAQRVAAQPTEPYVDTGDHCYDPFACGFCNYCNLGKPISERPLDWLPSLSPARRAQLAEEGIDDILDVPDDLLNTRQKRVKEHTLAKTVYFDAEGAAADLADLGDPKYFLDFETIQFPVPIWAGTRPYQQIPVQFSLHTLTAKNQLSHFSFLDLSGSDPSRPFAEALSANCGTNGPVFVYSAAFEVTRIRELAVRFLDLAGQLLAIIDRIVDLLPIARERYYHPSQHGSWSIKVVLPAAVPELSYDALEGVKDGSMAMEAYAEAIQPTVTAARKSEIEQQLIAYCRLDTYAMVRLWQFFNGTKAPVLPDMS